MVIRGVSEGWSSAETGSSSPSLTRFEVAHFSREAVTAHSRGRKPTDRGPNKHVSREAAAADTIAVAASRLRQFFLCFLRADARSYVLSSLRDSKVCNFKTYAPGYLSERPANRGT
jgi:hypothetical protein